MALRKVYLFKVNRHTHCTNNIYFQSLSHSRAMTYAETVMGRLLMFRYLSYNVLHDCI